MRILFVDQFGEIGGAQQCLLDLLPGVRERGWTACLAAPRGPLLDRALALGAAAREIPCGPYGLGRKSPADVLRFVFDTPRISAVLRTCPADLVYVNGPRVLPAAALGPSRRVIFHAHSRFTNARLAGWAIRRTHATVIANCRFVLEALAPYLRGPAHVVYNGVAEISAAHRAGSVFRIGLIGRFAPQKGQAEFLRAARLVSGARFILAGAALFGNHRYEALVRTLAEGLPVEFTGWSGSVSEVLARLDLLVAPSIGPEATTRVILEAFAAGVPVLAARTGGIPEVVEHGRTGFLLDSLEPEPFAAAMRDLIAQPRRLEEVRGQAQAAWRERFTLARYREDVLRIIEQTVPAESGTAARQAAPRQPRSPAPPDIRNAPWRRPPPMPPRPAP